jgi:hypothetical protein
MGGARRHRRRRRHPRSSRARSAGITTSATSRTPTPA